MLMTHKCSRYDKLDKSCRECEINSMEEHNSCFIETKFENIEAVDHPAHYKQANRRECIEEMRIVFGDEAVMQWAIMTAYKYRYRAGNKADNSAEQDHAKAEWYLKYAEQLRDLGY